MESTALDIILTAKDQASATIRGVSGEVDKLGNSAGTIGKGFTAAGAAMTAVGGGMMAIAGEAVQKTSEWAGEVGKLARQTGMSTEETSRFLVAAEHYGISADAMSASLRKFGAAVTQAMDPTKAHNSELAKMGVTVEDAHGKMLPYNDIMGEVADKFKAMPNGIAKNTEAIKLFGRAGSDLVPLLNQGKAGMEELGKEADKMGLTLSTKNVTDIRTYTMAQRQMKEEMAGIQVQIGAVVIPALVSITTFVSGLIAKFNEMSPVLKSTIIDFIAFGGPILVAVGTLTIFIGSMLSAGAVIAPVAGAIAGFALPVLAAVAALVAFIIVLNQMVAAHGGWHKVLDEARIKLLAIWDPIEKFLKPSFDRLLTSIQQLWGDMQKNLLPVLQRLFIALQPEIDALGQMATIIVEVLVVAVKVFMDTLSFIIPTIVPVVEFIVDFLTTIINGFNHMVVMVGGFIQNLRDHFWLTIGEILGFFLTLPIQIPLLIGEAIGAAIVWLMGVNWGSVFSNIGRAFSGAMGDVMRSAESAWHYVTSLNWGQIMIGIGRGIANAIIDLVQGGLNGALSSIPGHPQVHLPHFATGTSNFAAGGMAIVGEQGPEAVILPAGSKVIPNEQTQAMLRGGDSSGPQTNITIQAGAVLGTDDEIRKFAQLIHRELVRTARQHNLTFPSVGTQVQ